MQKQSRENICKTSLKKRASQGQKKKRKLEKSPLERWISKEYKQCQNRQPELGEQMPRYLPLKRRQVGGQWSLLTRDPQPYCDDCLVPLTFWSSALVLLIYDTATSTGVAVEIATCTLRVVLSQRSESPFQGDSASSPVESKHSVPTMDMCAVVIIRDQYIDPTC
ncbi:hypothetical protein E2C01_010042 [Portunus trituberculatus]|uniref:Uncharacterized protein n=1 Tax=Portunus trituberculatus TaxID=210409 RepID=A0A5B7D7L2_PORTR|nr:hypothetical protein [Portunus trituberculatus]